MRSQFDIEKVKDFIFNVSDTSSIYIGCDSTRLKKKDIWFAKYCTVVIIHYDSCHGGKIFHKFDIERDFDQKKDKPRLRLMNEVIRAANLYIELESSIGERHCEIHLDLNRDKKYGSSCVVPEALGYVKGMTNLTAYIKQDSWASTTCCDYLLRHN